MNGKNITITTSSNNKPSFQNRGNGDIGFYYEKVFKGQDYIKANHLDCTEVGVLLQNILLMNYFFVLLT